MSTDSSAPLILLGGTFDPPHIGHLVLAECARLQFDAARVVFLPAGDPWRKTHAEEGHRAVSPSLDRLQMTGLAIAGNVTFILDDRETRREGPTYTVDTLEELRGEGHLNLVLVLGADALSDMAHWKAPGRIRELATLAVAPRDAQPVRGSGLLVIDMPPLAITSTEIRTRVAADKPIRYLVPEPVEAYIRAHGLYRD